MKRRIRSQVVQGTCFESAVCKKKDCVKLKEGFVIGFVNRFCCYKPEQLPNSFFANAFGFIMNEY